MDITDLLALSFMGIGMGFSLMGVSTSVLFSPIIIAIYGSKLGNGILFFPFFLADMIVAWKRRKDFDRKIVLKLIPTSLLGMGLAALCAHYISEQIFRNIIAFSIFISSILFFMKRYETYLTSLGWFFGILGGASSYLANVSGPIFNVYLLSFKQEESQFISTRAVFFAALSIIKFFMYFMVFKNINTYTISRGLTAIPFIIIGIFMAKFLFSKISHDTFNKIVVLLGLAAAFNLLSL